MKVWPLLLVTLVALVSAAPAFAHAEVSPPFALKGKSQVFTLAGVALTCI